MTDFNTGRDPVFAELDRLIAESDIRSPKSKRHTERGSQMDRDFACPEPLPLPAPIPVASRHISDWKQRRWKYLRETGRASEELF